MPRVKVTAAPATPTVDQHNWPTVNVLNVATPGFPLATQVLGVIEMGGKQFYATASTKPGLKTVCIPGYSGPG